MKNKDRLFQNIIDRLTESLNSCTPEQTVLIENLTALINISEIIRKTDSSHLSLPLTCIEAILTVSTITPEHAKRLMEMVIESVAFIGCKVAACRKTRW